MLLFWPLRKLILALSINRHQRRIQADIDDADRERLRQRVTWVAAFIAIHRAALIRVLTAFEVVPWHPGIGSSTLLWLFAFGVFLYRYTAILASPRPDGKAG